MTDEELETAVRTAFVRQVRGAPVQGDMPERVRAASRSRERRERVLGVAVAAAAVVGVLALGRVLPFGPTGGRSPGVAAAVSPGSAFLAADELVVCLVQEDGAGVTDLMFATRPSRGSTSSLDATVERSSDGTLRLTYQEGAGRAVVRLELPSGSGGWQLVRNKRHVDIRGRDGWIGDDPALGDRVVSFDSGVDGVRLRLSVAPAAPDDAALVDLARRIILSPDPDDCA